MAVSRPKLLIIAGLSLLTVAWLFLLIGFSTPHWLEVESKGFRTNGFEKIGLWEACFNNFAYFKDYTGKTYFGCWWIFSYEYRPIWDYINPPWFLGIQIMMTLSLLLETASVVLGFLILKGRCPGKDNAGALITLSIMAMISAFLLAICIMIFGTKSVVDRQWIENPDKTYLSWSFGMIVFSGFLIIFGSLCIMIAANLVRITHKYTKLSKPYAGHEARFEPPTYPQM